LAVLAFKILVVVAVALETRLTADLVVLEL
jgi:hypothetical protein